MRSAADLRMINDETEDRHRDAMRTVHECYQSVRIKLSDMLS
jgi:hypothetical protein